MKSFLSLLILLTATLAGAQSPDIRMALPYEDGFVGVGSGGENVVQVWASKDGRKFDVVRSCKGLLLDAVLAGPRLVVATHSDGLYVIALGGAWRMEHTPVKENLLVLASNGQQALALTATQKWQLSADGKWITEAFGLPKEGVARRLAYGKGVWVAAGDGPAEDFDGLGPTRLAWTVDGKKWESGKIEAEDARGVMALAANAQGFLVITGAGDGLFSADGKVWKPTQLPGDPFSSELFTAAGKFWLLERAERPPNHLRSSADGKTWTSSESLPMEMRAQFLVEKNGQAWIFGTDSENFGVIARADQPHEPAAPLPNALAQVPAPDAQHEEKVNQAYEKIQNIIKRRKESISGLERLEKIANTETSKPIADVAAALAEFDRLIHASSPAEYPRAGIALLKTLRANSSAHPSLPAFTNAARDAIGAIVEVTSGFAGYYELVEKVNVQDMQPLMNRLSKEKSDSIRRYAKQVSEAYTRAQASRKPAEKPPMVPTVEWEILPASKKGKAPKDNDLNLQRVYERVASGERGAVADLVLAHRSQISVPGNEDLMAIWAKIYMSLGGPQAFLEDVSAGTIKPKTIEALAQDGSAISQFYVAFTRSEKTPIEQITDEVLALYEKSAAGGYLPALNYAKQILQARTGISKDSKTTAADWFKAAEAVYGSAATSKIEPIDPEKAPSGEITIAAPSKEVSDAWGKAGEALEAYGKKYAQADECLTQAEAAFRKADANAARRKMQEGLDLIPDHPGLLVLSARLHAFNGNLHEADKDLNAVIQKFPKYAGAHGVRALLKISQQDRQGARQSAETALKLTDQQPQALFALAQLDATENKMTDALAKLERIVATNPDYDEPRFLYGMLLLQSGKISQGIQELETLCQRNPFATAARQLLMVYYVNEANKPNEAWRHVNQMIEINHPQAKEFREELKKHLDSKAGQKK